MPYLRKTNKNCSLKSIIFFLSRYKITSLHCGGEKKNNGGKARKKEISTYFDVPIHIFPRCVSVHTPFSLICSMYVQKSHELQSIRQLHFSFGVFLPSLSLSLRRFCSALGNFLKINHKNRTELNHTINFDQFDYLPSSNQKEHDGSKPMGLVVWDGEMSWSTLKGPTHSVIDDAPIIPVHAVIRKISKHLSENNFCGRMFVKTHIFPSIPSKCK